jgi:hypothetical protein
MEAKDFVIRFGKKHKGKKLEEAPLLYLDWLIGQDWLNGYTRKIIEEYLSDPVIARNLKSELAMKADRE